MARNTNSLARDELVLHRPAGPPSLERRQVGVVRGWAVVVAVVVATVVTVAGTPRPVDAQAAPRITGYYYVGRTSNVSSSPVRKVEALCDPGDQVLGGGGQAFAATNGIARRLVLTFMAPVIHANGQHGYKVTATEDATGTTGEWSSFAFAICSEPVPGHEIVDTLTEWSSSSSKTTESHCGSGRVALGSGARIDFPLDIGEGGVGLHVARPAGGGGLTRAQAIEQSSGYSREWRLIGYAVCANTPQGYEVMHRDTTGRGAFVECSTGINGSKVVVGAGAVADAPLTQAFAARDYVGGGAERNADSGFVAAYATCADATPRRQ